MPKMFHLGDVLTVTTGRMMSQTGWDGLYAILNYMTKQNLFTHQLPRASNAAKPDLLRQYPGLANVTGDDITPDNYKERLVELVERYGEFLPVEPLPHGAYMPIDPITEAEMMMGDPHKVIVVNIDKEE